MKTKITAILGLFLCLLTLQSQVSLKKKSQKEINEILGTTEVKAIADQVFADDVIVQGSICIGFDCISGENFGADAIRLKENNLRIHFEDTSTTGSFPQNDWRIVINDAANGGENYFGIEDATAGRMPFKIAAGAPANSLIVKSNGNVGIGQADPVLQLHMTDGNTPAIRLEQDGSSGFTAQTWDIAGNEANFFVRDATNGSRLPLRIQTGSESGSLAIGNNGKVGIGFNSSGGFNFSPNTKFEVRHSSAPIMRIEESGKLQIADSLKMDAGGIVFPDGSVQTIAFGGSNGAYTDLDVTGTAHFRGNVFIKGNIFPSASFGPSDKRLKENLISMNNATNLLLKMYPKSYHFKKEYVKNLGLPERLQYGLLAQDIEQILPELIEEFETKSGDKFKSINYTSIIPLLIQGFKEQQALIETQAAKINRLEKEMKAYASLENRINALESASKNNINISNSKR